MDSPCQLNPPLPPITIHYERMKPSPLMHSSSLFLTLSNEIRRRRPPPFDSIRPRRWKENKKQPRRKRNLTHMPYALGEKSSAFAADCQSVREITSAPTRDYPIGHCSPVLRYTKTVKHYHHSVHEIIYWHLHSRRLPIPTKRTRLDSTRSQSQLNSAQLHTVHRRSLTCALIAAAIGPEWNSLRRTSLTDHTSSRITSS